MYGRIRWLEDMEEVVVDDLVVKDMEMLVDLLCFFEFFVLFFCVFFYCPINIVFISYLIHSISFLFIYVTDAELVENSTPNFEVFFYNACQTLSYYIDHIILEQ